MLIFDCDGVLVDSEPLACAVDADFLTELGVPYTAQEIARDFVGRSLSDMIAQVEASRGVLLPPDFPSRLNERLLSRFERELRPMPGVREAVIACTGLRCVASSSVPERIALSLRVTGLADLFGNSVFSATQVSQGKPAPDLFLLAAKRMGATPQDCTVVEDSVPGVLAGRAAGMRVIGFTGGGHCGPDHGARLAEAGAHTVIGRMSDLPGVL